jgi:acetyl-CoA acyltransferase
MVDPGALNMGVTAERIFDRFPQLTKERSDRFGMLSQHKAQAAYEAGKFQPDLVPSRSRMPRAAGASRRRTRAVARRPRWKTSPR